MTWKSPCSPGTPRSWRAIPGVGEVPEFVEKYTKRSAVYFHKPVAEALAGYTVAPRIRPTKVRGF